jgi:hypothetical protein
MLTYTVLAAVEDGPDHFQVKVEHFTTRSEAITRAIDYVHRNELSLWMIEVEDSDGRPLFMWDPNGDYLAESDYSDAQWSA